MDLVSRAMGADGDDDSFGPQLGSHFDFTLLFEHAVLTILPTSLCIVASPFYIVRYAKSPVCVASSLLLWAKLVSGLDLDMADRDGGAPFQRPDGRAKML